MHCSAIPRSAAHAPKIRLHNSLPLLSEQRRGWLPVALTDSSAVMTAELGGLDATLIARHWRSKLSNSASVQTRRPEATWSLRKPRPVVSHVSSGLTSIGRGLRGAPVSEGGPQAFAMDTAAPPSRTLRASHRVASAMAIAASLSADAAPPAPTATDATEPRHQPLQHESHCRALDWRVAHLCPRACARP